MKKIISGKVYDTRTAKEVGWFGNELTLEDPNNFTETLYRKRTGEYFIHGKGGSSTKYAEAVENNLWAYGERIMPMKYIEAKTWAEQNLDFDSYKKEFVEIIEDDSIEIITISVPTSVAAKFRRMAQERGISLSSLISSFSK